MKNIRMNGKILRQYRKYYQAGSVSDFEEEKPTAFIRKIGSLSRVYDPAALP